MRKTCRLRAGAAGSTDAARQLRRKVDADRLKKYGLAVAEHEKQQPEEQHGAEQQRDQRRRILASMKGRARRGTVTRISAGEPWRSAETMATEHHARTGPAGRRACARLAETRRRTSRHACGATRPAWVHWIPWIHPMRASKLRAVRCRLRRENDRDLPHRARQGGRIPQADCAIRRSQSAQVESGPSFDTAREGCAASASPAGRLPRRASSAIAMAPAIRPT